MAGMTTPLATTRPYRKRPERQPSAFARFRRNPAVTMIGHVPHTSQRRSSGAATGILAGVEGRGSRVECREEREGRAVAKTRPLRCHLLSTLDPRPSTLFLIKLPSCAQVVKMHDRVEYKRIRPDGRSTPQRVVCEEHHVSTFDRNVHDHRPLGDGSAGA